MTMGQSMGHYLAPQQRQRLDHALSLQLKQLLTLQQTLREPEQPYACKGLEGMLIAHKILNERNATGLLIGGLAQAVWNQRCKPDDLKTKHKDVDVMVLPYKNSSNELNDDIPINRFEGGVDWWLPTESPITVYTSDISHTEKNQRYWKNGNNVLLSFGIMQKYPLAPGLYIPDRDWIISMRVAEILAQVDDRNIQIEDEAIDAYEDKMDQQIKTRVPSFIRRKFPDHILSITYQHGTYWHHKVDAIELDKFDHATYVGINRAERRIE